MSNPVRDMTKGSPVRLILLFAVPVLIGSLFQLFYNMADTRIVGAYLGEQALASVGATQSLNSMIVGFMTHLMNGCAILTARYFGAKEHDQVRRSAACMLVLGVGTAAGMTVIFAGALRLILRALNTPEHLLAMSASYFRIILFGMVITVLYNGCAAALRAIGDTITPLLFLIAAVVLNVALDLFFVRSLHWGVEGAAFATVLAQLCSVIACLIYIYKKYPILCPKRADFRLDRSMAGQMYTSGLCMGFMLSIVNLGSVVLQSAINGFGDSIIVAHTAARRMTELLMMPFSVLGTTMSTFASQNYGAGRMDRVRSGLRSSAILGAAWCMIAIGLTWTIIPQLIFWVTGGAGETVVDTAWLYLRVDTALYVVTMIIVLYRNTLQSLGEHVIPLVSSVCEMIGKIAAVALLIPPLGYWGVILTEPIVWCIMVIPLIWRMHTCPAMRQSKEQRSGKSG